MNVLDTNNSLFSKKPWIKICGLTRKENALGCANLGADAIGLVFYKKSPRDLSIENAKIITDALPDHIYTIGVFVDEPYDRIMQVVNGCNLKGVQLHGNESPQLVEQLKSENLIVIKALFAARQPFLHECNLYQAASYLLVEYGKGVLPGGNAETWNYEILKTVKSNTPLILAGGLDTQNVVQAIQSASPSAVDISSGVEKSHGIKDLKKVESFIKAVRSITN